jgi:hypothetical protein
MANFKFCLLEDADSLTWLSFNLTKEDDTSFFCIVSQEFDELHA